MCDEIVRREKRGESKDESCEFYADSSFITKRSFFRFIKGHPREEYIPPWPEPNRCVYPKASAYYAFHEDTNPFTRLPSKCESREYGNVTPHFESPKEPYAIRDPYLETTARKKYLESKPTCFVVLGKPDLNTTKLATMIAESWKCVLISPLYLINQEIQGNSEKGKIMSDILKAGECLGPEIVMNLIASRLNKRDVFHKGYIVEGLPLIPNKTLDYTSYATDPNGELNTQVSQSLKKFFDSPFHRTCHGTQICKIHHSSALSDQEPGNEQCKMKSNYEQFIFSQVEDIFTTWPIKPTIIIYAMCPDADVISKRDQFYIDPISRGTIDTSLVGMSKNIEILFSHGKVQSDMNVSFELYQELMTEDRILDEYQRKYLLKRLSNRKQNVEAQLALYKRFAMPAIEKWILLHNPQNVIRVDGRVPVSLMFQIVFTRLRTLPISRVFLPKKFSDHTTFEFEGESPAMPAEEYEGKSNDEALQDFMNRETISPLYPWKLSTWNFLCPVELTRGHTVEGSPKFTVRFMNKIFFLSSNEAVDLFLENPRTFLFPFSPRPTCKIAVFGPKYSGKSELCDNLARILEGRVINVKEITKSFENSDSTTSFYSSIYTTLLEKTGTIVRAIKDVPKQEIDIETWRDGGYIVDGMYPDIECWKTMVEDSKIAIEDAIVLLDDDPYEHLLSKWHKIQSNKYADHFEGEYMEFLGEQDGEEEGEELIEYLRHIQKFELDWKAVEETIRDTCINLISCNIGKVQNVSEYVIDQIKYRYTDKARIMSDYEKEREKDLADYIAMTDGTDDVEEEEEEEGEERDEDQAMNLDFTESNRRFGDTGYYCPVALLNRNIFWKGKDDFSGVFMDKIYLLSSAEALEEFILDPQKLGLPLQKPLSIIPPLRVGIVGPPGSGKSTLADAIAREYGLAHVDYFNCFATFMKSRGMPSITPNDTLVSPEDLLNEVELPEDLGDEKYNSDAATVQTFVRKYWTTGGILPEKMRRECLLKFFQGLYNQSGILLEQFPSCPQDVDVALKYYTVPEIIIQLRCDRETAVERMMPLLTESWQNKLETKKRIEDLRYTKELEDFINRRDEWIDKMLRERLSRRHVQEGESENEYASSINANDEDTISGEYLPSDNFDSEEAELRRFELEEIWYQENPEPVLFTDWEDFETAKRRIEGEFQDMYDDHMQKLDATKNALENESIAYIVVDAEAKPKDILFRVMRMCYPHVCRNVSIVEKTYTVDPETTERLLNCGYFLLSSFGRWCPVQLHRNKIPLQMFLPQEAQLEIYPLVYRQFIFFLGGKDAQTEFSKNPLKYMEQDSCAPIVPFRLSIIGPPKCGKTTLARRFAKKYGVKVITRGAALRRGIKYFPWTESSRSAETHLRAGRVVPEECVHGAVEMYSIDSSSISQGFVLDGFPSNRKEYEDLTFLGLQPMIILDLKANVTFCLDCSTDETDAIKKPPNFSRSFLKHRYAMWEDDQGHFRDWLKKFTQNVIELDATMSRWYVWTRADEEVCSRYKVIRTYFREGDYDKVHSLKYMSVSPYEFKKHQSQFEAYCPLCLYYEETMTTSGPPPDNQGMVQYGGNFYWICSRHMNEFVRNPRNHLPPLNTAHLPEERPRILTEEVDLEHPCWAKRLQVKGFCLVTYVDSLPNRALVRGKSTVGVLYNDKVYLFCTEECRDAFLAQPDKYTKININFLHTPPTVDIKNLPCLGFLEQTVAKIIIEAVNQISVVRPKIPGLSPSCTAAIYLGVYLKAHNPSCALKETEVYEIVSKRICSRERILKVATENVKKKLNPFVSVPVYKKLNNPGPKLCEKLSGISRFSRNPSTSIIFRRTSPTQILYDPNDDSDTSRRVPVPDSRFDYLCEYFKPASKVPAFLNVVDIAGLVKGAAEGQGLGNSFLSHINACDGIFHLCRAFEDDDVTHIEGDVNPVRDLEIISEELRLKDIEFLNGHLEKLEKLVVRGNDKKLKPEYDTLLKVKGIMVDEKRHIRFADWNATDIEVLNKYLFLTSKPVIYLVNLSEKDYIRKKNKWLIKIKEWVDKNDPGAILIPFSGVFENKLLDMDEAERAKYLEESKVTSALDKIIVQGYKALQLQYFFTAGHDEVKAWTIQKGSKAPQAAGKIHTDFEKGFIMAEVMKFDDFKIEGSEAAVKAAGKYRQQGRNYVVEDGDIIFFKFNAGAGLKDAKKK